MGDSKPLLPPTWSKPEPLSLPTHDSNFRTGVTLNIVRCGRINILLVVVAFLLCIAISIWKDWISSTETHCHVPNYLPSISAAIGGYSPQKYIWRIAIALQATPRLLFAYIYFQHNLEQDPVSLDHVVYPLLCRATFSVIVLENLSLLLLTYVASNEWYKGHKLGFTLFIACSVLHQLLLIIVNRQSVMKMEDVFQRRLIYRKVWVCFVHLSCLVAAMYFYWRHNAYCEPGVYTAFAFFEYLVVLANMAFHYIFAWDFEGTTLKVVHRQTGPLKYSQA